MKVTWIEDVEIEEVQAMDEEGNLLFEEDGITPIMVSLETPLGTGVVTGINRGPMEGERMMDEPTTSFTEGYESKFYEIIFNEVLSVKSNDEIIDMEFLLRKDTMQVQYKSECTSHILAKYPEPIQRSAALNVYPLELQVQMSTDIADYIAEENRLNDEVEAAINDDELDAIVPNWEVIDNA